MDHLPHLYMTTGKAVVAVVQSVMCDSLQPNAQQHSMELRCLLLRTKAMTNLGSVLKSRDITLPTKVCIVKAMVFPVVMYGC